MSVTIKDIAKDLKVSKTTVSFVLSGIGSSMGINDKNNQTGIGDKIGYEICLSKSLIG